MNYKSFLGYCRGEDDMPEIVPEEAEIVQTIYRRFLEGGTIHEIAKALTAAGIPTPMKRKAWCETTVQSILPLDSHNGLVIKPLDQSFKIYLDFDTKGNEPCCGLQRQAENWNGNAEVREEMLPCGTGWTATFAYEKKCYRELCIPLSESVTDEDGNALNELDIQVITVTEAESQAAVKHRVYTELVNSIVV